MKLTEIRALDFDLATTLNSGQVFHWEKLGDGFIGAIGDRPVYVEQRGDSLLTNCEDEKLIRNYFALDHPLAEICASFPVDPVMGAAKEFCRGLRIVRQPKWECLATFICSSMKQVAHIRQISRSLRERFGEVRKTELPCSIENADGGSAAPRAMIEFGRLRRRRINIEQGTARSTNNYVVQTFPSAERVAQSSENELRKRGLGYRAKNLLASARLVASGDVNLEKLAVLTDLDLRARLCELPGVGSKVANCVMLFAYERLRAFPIDVWIERVLREKYFPRARKLNAARLQAFTEGYFGDHGGYAQQYLFHHARKTARRSRTIGSTRSKRRRLSQSRV